MKLPQFSFPSFSMSVPDPKWVNDMHKALQYTPDVWLLEQFERWNVFICGQEQQHHPHYRRISAESNYQSPAYTTGKFSMWKKRLGNETFPIPLDDVYGDARHHEWGDLWGAPSKQIIRGEIHTMTMDQIISLDEHYRNTVQFSRRRVLLHVPYKLLYEADGKKHVSEMANEVVSAWMYVGLPGYWEHTISNSEARAFSPIRLFDPITPNIAKHYYFGLIEYEDN